MKTVYEWDIETVDTEFSDVLDHDHAFTLKELLRYKTQEPDPGQHYELVLVRDLYCEDHGVKERSHWYPMEDGEAEFSNGLSVPKKFIKEFERIWK